MKNIDNFLIGPELTVKDIMVRFNANVCGIVFVVDEDRRLIGVVTDGDVRRTILDGWDPSLTAKGILERKSAKAKPIVAYVGQTTDELVQIVKETSVTHFPLLNDKGQVVDLVGVNELLLRKDSPMQAVVMAGGLGTRLYPLTSDTPKPMLPMGDRPIMERIINRLSRSGISKVHVTTHYLKEQISDHFGSGDRFGVDLEYVAEKDSLGTAGGLSLMETPEAPLLVINGDILTDVDFGAMLEFHRENGAALTMGVRRYIEEVPYGVVHCEGPYVCRLVEKPTHSYLVNAGIYLMEPSAHRKIPKGVKYDMTDLIQALLDDGERVVSFPVWEYWRDIGQHDDYRQAQEDLKSGKLKS